MTGRRAARLAARRTVIYPVCQFDQFDQFDRFDQFDQFGRRGFVFRHSLEFW